MGYPDFTTTGYSNPSGYIPPLKRRRNYYQQLVQKTAIEV
jgi:hypothetical protein